MLASVVPRSDSWTFAILFTGQTQVTVKLSDFYPSTLLILTFQNATVHTDSFVSTGRTADLEGAFFR
jgi:hypothetical protein